MSKSSLNLSGKIDRITLRLFDDVVKVSESLSIPFFIVGASARDIILSNGYGIKATRATNDIDLAVQVAEWKQYENFKKGLVETEKFQTTREIQRLSFEGSMLIDIVPFGAIIDKNGSFSWPHEHEIKMSALGFKESFENAIKVILREEPLLKVLFSNLAGLALMKLISWDDRYPERKKDAMDLGFIIHNYLDAGNQERLFEEAIDIFDQESENEDFDYLKAGARLLGRDMASMAVPESKARVMEILEKETGEKDRYKLIEEMRDINRMSGRDFELYLELLEKLKSGFMEKS